MILTGKSAEAFFKRKEEVDKGMYRISRKEKKLMLDNYNKIMKKSLL